MQRTKKLEIDEYEQGILINALNLLRSQQIREKRPTDPIDDLIMKIITNIIDRVQLGYRKRMSHIGLSHENQAGEIRAADIAVDLPDILYPLDRKGSHPGL